MVVNIWGSAWTSARRDGAVGRAAAREACPNLNYRLPSAEQRLGFFKKLRLSCRVDFAVPDLGALPARLLPERLHLPPVQVFSALLGTEGQQQQKPDDAGGWSSAPPLRVDCIRLLAGVRVV